MTGGQREPGNHLAVVETDRIGRIRYAVVRWTVTLCDGVVVEPLVTMEGSVNVGCGVEIFRDSYLEKNAGERVLLGAQDDSVPLRQRKVALSRGYGDLSGCRKWETRWRATGRRYAKAVVSGCVEPSAIVRGARRGVQGWPGW